MPLVDLPADAELDAPQGTTLVPLPDNATLDAPQMQGAMRLPAMLGGALAKGAAEGAGAIGDIDNLAHSLFTRGIFDPLHRLVTGRPANAAIAAASNADPASSAALLGYGRNAGIIDRPDLMPQNGTERYLSAGAEGAGAMAPALALGSGLGAAARGLAQGAAGGIAGEGAADLFPSHPMLARLAGNIVGALGAGGAMNAGNRLAGAAIGNSTPTLDAYRALGIEPTLAGDVTGSPTLQMIQAYAAKAPGGANRVHAASENAIEQWGRALEDTASGLGNAATLQDAGQALQSNAKNWLSQFKADSKAAWNQLDLYVPKTASVPVTNYATTLSDVRNAMPNAPATANVLQPALSKNLLDSLIQDTQKGPLTWQDVKGVRTRIGEMLAEPQLVADTSHADLKRIYGALSDDMQNAVAARGPQAQQAFNAAADLTRQGHGFVENVLSRVLKGDKITPEAAANAALNTGGTGGTMLGAIRQEMPQAADELAAYKLRDMALANPGQQNATGSRLSPGTFLTGINKMSPEAQDALFSQVGQRLGDLSTSAEAMKRTERFLNTSNTGTHNATAHAMAGAASAIPAGIEAYHLGGPLAAGGAAISALLAPYVPSYLAARLSTSPALTRVLAAPAAVPQSAALMNRAATLPPLLRALGALPFGGAGLQ